MQYPNKQWMQDQNHREVKIDLRLVGKMYKQYEYSPQLYILEKIRVNNPWPQMSQQNIMSFLQNISAFYNPVPYHNLTHAFDVMTHLDMFLTKYGWQQKLGISENKRILMLVAAYAHDAGHEGLTNAFYKSSNHPMAKPSSSPLQYMHISLLRKTIREHQLEISLRDMEEMIEMILRTDNYYHGWLLEKSSKLKGASSSTLRQPKNALTASCLLLHAADLNNTCKDTEMNTLWTNYLYQEFQYQSKFEAQRGWKSSFGPMNTSKERAGSNVFFLDHMVFPLFREIADIDQRFQDFIKKLERNKQHWLSLLNRA